MPVFAPLSTKSPSPVLVSVTAVTPSAVIGPVDTGTGVLIPTAVAPAEIVVPLMLRLGDRPAT